MKNFILLGLFLISSAIGWADINFVSLSNSGGKTTVVFTITGDERDPFNGMNIENIILETNGKRYKPTHVNANTDKDITVIADFKKLKKFDNTHLKCTVNGKELSMDIQKDLQQPKSSSSFESDYRIYEP